MQQSSPGSSGGYGFVGAGAITAAIVAGLHVVDAADPPTVFLSPRGRRLGRELASRFPNVRVCRSNQEIVGGRRLRVLSRGAGRRG